MPTCLADWTRKPCCSVVHFSSDLDRGACGVHVDGILLGAETLGLTVREASLQGQPALC
jgi:hypothetical protein